MFLFDSFSAEKINETKYKVMSNKLLLRNIDYTFDGEEFQCSAQNAIGPSKTESVKLNVLCMSYFPDYFLSI